MKFTVPIKSNKIMDLSRCRSKGLETDGMF